MRFSNLKKLSHRGCALLLAGSLFVSPAFSVSVSSFTAVDRRPDRIDSRLFTDQAITPELIAAPAVPELRAGTHLRSEINYEASHDERLAQLHGRAAVSLSKDSSRSRGLTEGQKIYGQSHYNVDGSIDHILQTLEPGIESAIRRQLHLREDEPLPDDMGQRIVFLGVGGYGVENPVALVGRPLAGAFHVPFHPVRKIENANGDKRAQLVLGDPHLIKGKIVLWIDQGVMGGGTFLESRQQLLDAGAQAVEPFFIGSAPHLSLRELVRIVQRSKEEISLEDIANSGRSPTTAWIDEATNFSGDRNNATQAFRSEFLSRSNLSPQAKLNFFFNILERFQNRGLPHNDVLIWIAQSFLENPELQSVAGLARQIAGLVTTRVQENSSGSTTGLHRELFMALAGILTANHNRLPIALAGTILSEIRNLFSPASAQMRMEIVASGAPAAYPLSIESSGHLATTLHVQLSPRVHNSANALMPITQTFHLQVEDRSLAGEAFWMLGYFYLRIGNRWIRVKAKNANDVDLAQLPWPELVSGQLLLGNPDLRHLIDTQTALEPRLSSVLSDLPRGFEAVVEKHGFVATHYLPDQIAHAVHVLETIHPYTVSRHEGHFIGEQELYQFLDAFVTLSFADAWHADLWDQARLELNLFVGLLSDAGTAKDKEPAQLHLLRILGEKRKLGYNFLVTDMAKAMQTVVKSVMAANGHIFLLSNGKVDRVDAFNAGRWVPRSKAPQSKDLREAAKAGSYHEFVVPFLMLGGNATRIRDVAFGNKVTASILWIESEAVQAFDSALRRRGLDRFADTIQVVADMYVVSMLHLLALIMPKGVNLVGLSSIAATEQMFGNGEALVQSVAHQLKPDGSLEEDKVDLGGHGDAVWSLVSSKKAVQESVERAGVRVLLQGEFTDPSLFDTMAMQVVSGKAVMPVAVVPQPVRFVPEGEALIREALDEGVPVAVEFPDGRRISVISIDIDNTGKAMLANGESYNFGSKVQQAEDSWKLIQTRMEEISHVEDSNSQRDQLINEMAVFDRDIAIPLAGKVVKTESDGSISEVPLVKIDYNAGGMLAEINGTVSFIENSQFGDSHVLRKSSGEEVSVSKAAIVAIYFRDFNLNFLGWDSFVEKACLTQEAQGLYREYRQALAETSDREQQKLLRQDYARKIYEANPGLTSEEWARLAHKVEMLMTVAMVPPFEAKGKKGDPKTIKFNKMAQNVSSFLVTMALSDITAEDVDVIELQNALVALEAAGSEAERLRIRNNIKFLHGKSLADLKIHPVPGGPDERQLIVVEPNEFVQVKEPPHYGPFSDAYNRVQDIAKSVLQPGLFAEKRVVLMATANMARDLWKAGAFDLGLATTIAWAAWHEAEHGGYGQSQSGKFSVSGLHAAGRWEASLLREFRALVIQGLSKDKWTGWLTFEKKWKGNVPSVAAPGDKSGLDFDEHPIYLHESLQRALPARAA